MKLSQYTIQQIVPFIIGKDGEVGYMKGKMLVNWFNQFGRRDVYDEKGLPPNPNNQEQRMSRKQYAEYALKSINNTDNIKLLIESYLSECPNSIDEIRHIIQPERFDIEILDGKPIIIGATNMNPIQNQTDAHFDEIQGIVIGNLLKAQLSIHIAMAWFTNQKIADVLKVKAKENVDIKIVIHDDFINQEYGANLDGLTYKLVKTQHGGIMHNKFCVIDNRVVITGSYNWSTKAETKNEENVIVDYSPDTVMKYALQFKELYFQE